MVTGSIKVSTNVGGDENVGGDVVLTRLGGTALTRVSDADRIITDAGVGGLPTGASSIDISWITEVVGIIDGCKFLSDPDLIGRSGRVVEIGDIARLLPGGDLMTGSTTANDGS